VTDPDARGVYAAEQVLRATLDLMEQVEDRTYDFHGYHMQVPDERKFADLDSIQRYYEMVVQLPSVKARWPKATAPRVRARKSGAFAHYCPIKHEVAICIKKGERFAMREIVVLHELAHSLERDGHGPEFRGAFVFLVELCIGQEMAMLLGSYFHEQLGVGHKVPKVRGLQNY